MDNSKAEYKLNLGADYEVIGIIVIKGKTYYFIDDNENLFPKPYPKDLFLIIENKLSNVTILFSKYEELYNLIIMPDCLCDFNKLKEVIVESEYGKDLYKKYCERRDENRNIILF